MKYEKCCRNCEYAYLSPRECKGCDTFGDNKYENFKLREELAKIENGALVELPKDIRINLLRCIVFKTKYGRVNYFEPFKGVDSFGQPQVMSMDELLYRTVIKLLGLNSNVEVEAKLAELKGEK